MIKKLLAVILAVVITVVWIEMSYAEQSAGPILRILTYKAVPGKQEQLLEATSEDILKLYAGRKGLQ